MVLRPVASLSLDSGPSTVRWRVVSIWVLTVQCVVSWSFPHISQKGGEGLPFWAVCNPSTSIVLVAICLGIPASGFHGQPTVIGWAGFVPCIVAVLLSGYVAFNSHLGLSASTAPSLTGYQTALMRKCDVPTEAFAEITQVPVSLPLLNNSKFTKHSANHWVHMHNPIILGPWFSNGS